MEAADKETAPADSVPFFKNERRLISENSIPQAPLLLMDDFYKVWHCWLAQQCVL